MNVAVHYPKSADGVRALQERVAAIHAEAVIRCVQNLSCSQEQKLRLIEELERSLRG